MKSEEKKAARRLRQKGLSLNEISQKLKVAKSTASLWVRDIELNPAQKQKLSAKGQKQEVVEKRRLTRLKNENARRQIVVSRAKQKIKRVSNKELFLMGISLYWAEGSKTRRGIVEFSNSDAQLIKIMMRFFKEICWVPKEKFRGHIHLHHHLNAKKAENYWHKVSGIPLAQFFKTTQQHNKASKGKKDNLPHGTFSIYICDTELFLKIQGWMQGVFEVITREKT